MHSQPSPARAGLLTAPAAAARPQTLVLAGFYIEEIAGVRQLLDEIGAAEVGGGSGWCMDGCVAHLVKLQSLLGVRAPCC